MTREEAIDRLKEGAPFNEIYYPDWEEALAMAIKALEQEPCEDAISRQAVLSLKQQIGAYGMDIDSREVESLPPVRPIPISELKDIRREIECCYYDRATYENHAQRTAFFEAVIAIIDKHISGKEKE